MPDEKILIDNICGKAITATPAQIGDLIASLQCLPEALEGGDDEREHTLNVLKRRLQDIGVVFDRRETEEYIKEMTSNGDDSDEQTSAPTP
jgi:hypothetical protein